MGLPGYRVVLFLRAMAEHPARCSPPSPVVTVRAAVAFGEPNLLGTWDAYFSWLNFPWPTRSLHLRIAGRVATTVARFATGWAGSPLAGRDLHPLDRYSEFRNVTDDVPPFRPAFPGHFHDCSPLGGIARAQRCTACVDRQAPAALGRGLDGKQAVRSFARGHPALDLL